MSDDKKNIPDTGKVDEPLKLGKVEPVKVDSPVQDQPVPTKAVMPTAAKQPVLADKEISKDRSAPVPSKGAARVKIVQVKMREFPISNR